MRFRWLLIMLLLAAGAAAKGRDVSLAQNQVLLTERHEGWGKARCQACHVLSLIHKNAPHIRGIVRDKGFDTCTGCHGDNGTGARRPCLVCHNDRDLPLSPLQTGTHTHDFDRFEDRPLTDQDCLVCHQAADMDGVWERNVDLTRIPDATGLADPYRHESEFCLRCHNRDHQQPGFALRGLDYRDPLIAIEDDWRHIDTHGYPKGSGQRTYAGLRSPYQYPEVLACTECHAMHGTDNPKLIIDDSRKGAFLLPFRDAGIPVRVFSDIGDYSQLCVLCHQMETPVEDALIDTGNGLYGVHQVGTNCTLCHTHGRAAQVGL
ncbi:hypothetical protein MIT9_P1078 [Methylomarinovum caldicuralii]|uniref:Doubled CXXCH motif domain-containing protein n=2 Tax=Methylomarinovum caldicuralii TaxID=438856 RepID=A0AAU9CEU8_9GAMM|nr:hypothetical protein MIT9_P1078 [Methylomarinovum caldicuralii]